MSSGQIAGVLAAEQYALGAQRQKASKGCPVALAR